MVGYLTALQKLERLFPMKWDLRMILYSELKRMGGDLVIYYFRMVS
jgi:hypothetical protein